MYTNQNIRVEQRKPSHSTVPNTPRIRLFNSPRGAAVHFFSSNFTVRTSNPLPNPLISRVCTPFHINRIFFLSAFRDRSELLGFRVFADHFSRSESPWRGNKSVVGLTAKRFIKTVVPTSGSQFRSQLSRLRTPGSAYASRQNTLSLQKNTFNLFADTRDSHSARCNSTQPVDLAFLTLTLLNPKATKATSLLISQDSQRVPRPPEKSYESRITRYPLWPSAIYTIYTILTH